MKLDNLLKLPTASVRTLNDRALKIRQSMISEAISFPIGDDVEKKYTLMYKVRDYSLQLGKPGKEVFSANIKYKDGYKGNNPHDMTPTTFYQGKIKERVGTFEQIFTKFVQLVPKYDIIEVLGALCVRNALVLDHRVDENGNWRYSPPNQVVEDIQKNLPQNFDEPVLVFLFYLELIALNEDVKYHTLGYDIRKGYGRYNNLLTYAHVLGIILNRKRLSEAEFLLALMKFAGNLVRPPAGLSPLSLKAAQEVFAPLKD